LSISSYEIWEVKKNTAKSCQSSGISLPVYNIEKERKPDTSMPYVAAKHYTA
jgi:dsRNA-specific ribonuclease